MSACLVLWYVCVVGEGREESTDTEFRPEAPGLAFVLWVVLVVVGCGERGMDGGAAAGVVPCVWGCEEFVWRAVPPARKRGVLHVCEARIFLISVDSQLVAFAFVCTRV